jgi:hypothetical protein
MASLTQINAEHVAIPKREILKRYQRAAEIKANIDLSL